MAAVGAWLVRDMVRSLVCEIAESETPTRRAPANGNAHPGPALTTGRGTTPRHSRVEFSLSSHSLDSRDDRTAPAPKHAVSSALRPNPKTPGTASHAHAGERSVGSGEMRDLAAGMT